MALGGMRDHIGGGFHRYSVDGNWRVPHFEKMLYDQAQLVLAYLEAAQASDDPFFAQIAEDTLQYVERDMTDAAGGFYSAEDADSVPPASATSSAGKPARRTRWKARSTSGARTRFAPRLAKTAWCSKAATACCRTAMRRSIRSRSSSTRTCCTPRSRLPTSRGPAARRRSRSPKSLLRARQILFDVRNRRPRPQLDDKVLTAWNGLMIAAFARASRVLAGGAMEP